MKKITLLTFTLLASIAFGQEAVKTKPNFNRWSLELNTGLNKTVRNFAPGYSSGLADFGTLNIGVRRMFNAYAGLDLKMNFDRFHDGKPSPDFASNMGRISLSGVLNLSNLLNFYQWTDRVGLLFHAGVGAGNFVDEGFPMFSSTKDKVGSVTIGITPQLKLNEKWSLNLDASIVGLARMHHTFDYTQPKLAGPGSTAGFNGQFFTGTIGIQYYLGKKEKHADWSPTKSVSKDDLDAMKAENEKMRLGMNDDDKDGVPNYLDQDLNTPEGAPVNAKGISDPSLIDSDNDGIKDAFDACPTVKGPFSTNGCPDKDGDGIPDAQDKCPDVKGSVENDGCANSKNGNDRLSAATEYVYFETSSSTVSVGQNAKLDAVAKELKANPSYKVLLNGYADNTGSEAYNDQLSNSRAFKVKSFLINKGIDGSRIETNGFGESKPADSNDTEAGRAKNRRVEVTVAK